jgi:hypothetical protein
MALPSDDDVRIAIKARIVLKAPLAVVKHRWELKFDPTQWPGLLRSPADQGRTHGYVITRVNNRGRRQGVGRVARFWTYRIMALHYYDTGTDSVNSEKLFKAELDAIVANFDANGNISNETGILAMLLEDQLLEFNEDGSKQFGSDCLFALGTLIVEPCG